MDDTDLKTICPDTVILNRLLEQNVDCQSLVCGLRSVGGQLALNVQVIFESAKSFQTKRVGFETKGTELFLYLEKFGRDDIRFLKHPNRVLQEEALFASGDRSLPAVPWRDAADTKTIWDKIAQLSRGIFNEHDAASISVIQTEAETMRAEGKVFDSAASPGERDHHELAFNDYIRAAWPRWSGPGLIQKLQDAFPGATQEELAPVAQKMLADESYRTAHAMVRGDFYVRWRALNGAVSKDVHGDCLNIVHGAHCDVYATADSDQEKWAPYVLTRTKFASYSNSAGRLAPWLTSLVPQGN
jgi:hypothetical protein